MTLLFHPVYAYNGAVIEILRRFARRFFCCVRGYAAAAVAG
jgi:hypothetical protein